MLLPALVLVAAPGRFTPAAGASAGGGEAASASTAGERLAELGLIVRMRAASGAGDAARRGEAGDAMASVRERIQAALTGLDSGSWAPAFPRSGGEGARGGERAESIAGHAAAHRLRADLDHVAVLRFARPEDRALALERLRRHPEVVYVEPVSEIQLEREVLEPMPPHGPPLPRPGIDGTVETGKTPGDARYPEQWYLAAIGMPAVWAHGTGTPNVLVAVVDTGIETGHPDLAPNVAGNAAEANGQPGVDDDQNGYVDDVRGWNTLTGNDDVEDGFGHGSHVAGIIGAASDDQFGIVGVTWDVDLLAVRMFNDFGRGTNLAGAQGITYAADRGAQVINMSWGTGRLSPVIKDAVAYAAASGAVLVASAGNAGGRVTENFPAAYDEVIGVGATTASDGIAGFSNYGVRVDLAAPGVDLLSSQHGAHFSLSGTSQSAALVSGVAAHLCYRHPTLHPEEIRARMRIAAADVGRTGWDPFSGAGRLDAARALAVPSAPVADLRAPRTLDATGLAEIPVIADALPGAGVPGLAEYILDVGISEDPTSFRLVAGGAGGEGIVLTRLALAGYEDGEITLRLRVRDGSGFESEDRTLLKVDRRPPLLVRREHVNRLAGPRLEQWVRYQANEIVTAKVFARPAGSDEAPQAFSSVEGGREHVADFGGLLPGPYEYWIELEDLAGFRASIAEPTPDPTAVPFGRETLPIIDVPPAGFHLRERIPSFELGVVADFDGDGFPEVWGEARGSEPSGRWTVLGPEAGPGSFLAVRHRGGPGLPLAARDVDQDGVADVLIADQGLSLIAGGDSEKPRVLWHHPQGDRKASAALTDVDDDDQIEVLFSTLGDDELHMIEWNGAAFDSIPVPASRPTRAGSFAVGDYDGDGYKEIALGSLSGELVVLEWSADGIHETAREPFLGGVANAVTAADLGDADGDGRREFAISAVGALLSREERPAVAIHEAPGNDRYAVTSTFEFRDKNTPYDNALAAGDVDGDGMVEVLVAQAGDVYLLAADRDDRFLPIWRAPREGGGRAAIVDLDRDGKAELLVSERSSAGPMLSVYAQRAAAASGPALPWEPVVHPLGNAIEWQSPASSARVFDLAVYRAAKTPGDGGDRPVPPVLESDLAPSRIFERRGELTAGGTFHDAGVSPGARDYYVAYTIDNSKSRVRVLEGPRTAAPADGVPRLVLVNPYPNPSAGSLQIPLGLLAPGPVKVRIVDVAGRVRRLLYDGELPPGYHPLTWDGRDDEGHRLARGIYFVAASGLGEESAARITLLAPEGN